ncbi:hypothetical protein [Variovorax sp. E3]|uniref:hypothetical protein n=1 Tax=Variovorax sp. E3 TaxID=1914993 RepID=UPI0022B68ABA|nr:hypothetical protein [Variovorax sp. E3]
MQAPTAAPDVESGVAADALMVARMRLVLSVSALLAVAVDAGDNRQQIDTAVWLSFSGYILHSLLVYAFTRLGSPYFQGKAIHWSDVLWFTLIIFMTDGVQSLFFLFYFFAILTSSFRWGFEEGARVTVASVASFAACGLGTSTGGDAPQLLMRTTFLLALGHMIVHWGGSKLGLQRRLALLSDVSQLSNPRFGAGRTIARTMEKTLAFFRASHCILLTRDTSTGNWILRTLRKDDACEHVSVETIGHIAESPLMALAPDRTVLCNRLPWPLNRFRAPSHGFDAAPPAGTSRTRKARSAAPRWPRCWKPAGSSVPRCRCGWAKAGSSWPRATGSSTSPMRCSSPISWRRSSPSSRPSRCSTGWPRKRPPRSG